MEHPAPRPASTSASSATRVEVLPATSGDNAVKVIPTLQAEPVPPRTRRLPTARGLLAWIPGIPGFVGLWLYLLDDDMPLKHRLSIFFSIVYLIMPTDFLPEMLLGPLGLVDDAAVLSGLIAFAASATMRSFRAQARKLLRGELDDQPD